MATRPTLALAAVTLLVLAACTGPAASPTVRPAVATPTTAAVATSTAAAATPTAVAATPTTALTAAPTVDACATENLALKKPGRLTLSTDIPAFPPWWGGTASEQYPNEPEGGSAWTESDFSAEPYSMEGFEGAVAYAIAEAMGFGPDEVDWIPNAVFEQAFAPGVKAFDVHMAQIAITDERAQAVTFSEPYFESNQSVIALTGNAITTATSIADLQGYRLGAAANTTAFDFLENTIQPTTEPSVLPDNSAALAALQGNTVDGIIVDLVTAFFMRDAQLEDFETDEPEGTIVGQFGPPAEPDHVGFVLELDNPLVACVNQAIATIRADGTHQAFLDEWINTGEEVPFLE